MNKPVAVIDLENLDESGEFHKLDLQGEVCPYTFVYTKLKLEEMDANEIVEVIVDYEPAIENVPRSVVAQDLGECLEIKEIKEKKWRIRIQKK